MSDITADDTAGARLNIGKVLRETFSTYSANFVSFMVLGATVNVAVIAVFVYVLGMNRTYVVITADDSGPYVIYSVLSALVNTYVAAGVTYESIRHLNKSPVGFGAMLSAAASLVLPVCLVSILMGILVVLGLMALIVPGIILTMMFMVAVPVVVAEREGPSDALGRSRQLTKGYRWQIFGGYLLCIGIDVIVVVLHEFVFGESGPLVYFVGEVVSAAVETVLFACFSAALYVNLRLIKEGVGTAQLASVFD